MAKVASEAGSSFDPRVVGILQRRYVELERLAREQPFQAPPKLSTDIRVERGAAPAAGFAESEKPIAREQGRNYCDAMGEAQREARALAEFGRTPGAALSLDDMLSLLSVRVKRLVAHDSMAVYVVRNEVLVPEFVSGENFRLFSSLRIPIGEGLSGWVAQNDKPILNGNPSVEPGYLNDPSKYSTLRSALAVPLGGASSVVAVLALYRVRADGFSQDELKVLRALGARLGLAIEEALRHSGGVSLAAHAGGD
jgi:putative methionine-R-sulfoxide reductase with GAF domain